jgi:apolipoprotein N-acyltransferase
MKSNAFDTIRALALLAGVVFLFFVALVIVGGLVSSWIQAQFGSLAVVAMWVLLAVCLSILFGWGMGIKTMNAVLDAYVAVQTADDKGEVHRQKAMIEEAKAQRELLAATIWGIKQDRPQIVENEQRRLPAPVEWDDALAQPVEGEWSDL